MSAFADVNSQLIVSSLKFSSRYRGLLGSIAFEKTKAILLAIRRTKCEGLSSLPDITKQKTK
ncbi:hypothetical protein Hanom_Chr05g00460071 [Helianthus anomalus]